MVNKICELGQLLVQAILNYCCAFDTCTLCYTLVRIGASTGLCGRLVLTGIPRVGVLISWFIALGMF